MVVPDVPSVLVPVVPVPVVPVVPVVPNISWDYQQILVFLPDVPVVPVVPVPVVPVAPPEQLKFANDEKPPYKSHNLESSKAKGFFGDLFLWSTSYNQSSSCTCTLIWLFVFHSKIFVPKDMSTSKPVDFWRRSPRRKLRHLSQSPLWDH